MKTKSYLLSGIGSARSFLATMSWMKTLPMSCSRKTWHSRTLSWLLLTRAWPRRRTIMLGRGQVMMEMVDRASTPQAGPLSHQAKWSSQVKTLDTQGTTKSMAFPEGRKWNTTHRRYIRRKRRKLGSRWAIIRTFLCRTLRHAPCARRALKRCTPRWPIRMSCRQAPTLCPNTSSIGSHSSSPKRTSSPLDKCSRTSSERRAIRTTEWQLLSRYSTCRLRYSFSNRRQHLYSITTQASFTNTSITTHIIISWCLLM